MNGAYFNTLWLFFAIRFIIVQPCMMWFWINKFRKRNMSTYDAIEDFILNKSNCFFSGYMSLLL
ncbi:hypothetical protein ACS0TY_022742 [Phlomoides rotata]